jgi:hypothetical protein
MRSLTKFIGLDRKGFPLHYSFILRGDRQVVIGLSYDCDRLEVMQIQTELDSDRTEKLTFIQHQTQ